MEYENMRYFADTWGLVFLVLAFVGMIGFVFARNSAKRFERQGRIPLRED